MGGLPHQTPIVYCEGPVHRSEKEIITWRYRKTHKDPRLETHQKSASVLLQLALCSRVLGPLVALLPFWFNIVIIKRGMRGRSFKFTCKRGKNGRHHRRPQKRGYLGEVVSSTLKTDKMGFSLTCAAGAFLIRHWNIELGRGPPRLRIAQRARIDFLGLVRLRPWCSFTAMLTLLFGATYHSIHKLLKFVISRDLQHHLQKRSYINLSPHIPRPFTESVPQVQVAVHFSRINHL